MGWLPLAISFILSLHGFKRKSLSLSGAIAALLIGALVLSVKLKTFGYSLISFYLIGSQATKIGRTRKQLLEEGNHHSGAGHRNAWQVLSTTCPAFLSAIIWQAVFTPDSPYLRISPLPIQRSFDGKDWCAITFHSDTNTPLLSTLLLLVSLGHFACCLGDTLASELGILSSTPPLLITTCKHVPPGTNGAVSVLGTASSFFGGFLMGLTYSISLYAENPACRGEGWRFFCFTVLCGSFAGVIGSLIDSLLGATLQETRYSLISRKVVVDHAENVGETKVISGSPFLSNNQVNLISACSTGLLLASARYAWS